MPRLFMSIGRGNAWRAFRVFGESDERFHVRDGAAKPGRTRRMQRLTGPENCWPGWIGGDCASDGLPEGETAVSEAVLSGDGMYHDAVAALVLGLVERLVGQLQQGFRLHRRFIAHMGNAQAHRDAGRNR